MRYAAIVACAWLALGCESSENTSVPGASVSAAPSSPAAGKASTPALVPAASAPVAAPALPSAAPAPTPTSGTLRLVFATDADSPPSTEHVDTLKKWIEKGGAKTDAAPVKDDERAYASALSDSTDTPRALPVGWAAFETIVLLRIEPPRGSGSQKRSAGRTHLVIVRPPARQPVFSTIYTERSQTSDAPPVDAGRLGAWIQTHLTLREKGRVP